MRLLAVLRTHCRSAGRCRVTGRPHCCPWAYSGTAHSHSDGGDPRSGCRRICYCSVSLLLSLVLIDAQCVWFCWCFAWPMWHAMASPRWCSSTSVQLRERLASSNRAGPDLKSPFSEQYPLLKKQIVLCCLMHLWVWFKPDICLIIPLWLHISKTWFLNLTKI